MIIVALEKGGMEMAKRPKTFHCDGYYYGHVCPARGDSDPADVRRDEEGWIRLPRCFCKTMGISPLIRSMCPHCIEHRHHFRTEPRILTGPVEDMTPFQVKEEGTAHTIKAWTTARSVKRFLKKADNPDDVYGVDTRSGRLIR